MGSLKQDYYDFQVIILRGLFLGHKSPNNVDAFNVSKCVIHIKVRVPEMRLDLRSLWSFWPVVITMVTMVVAQTL